MTASGILNVDKERGLSSHDVVALVRKGLRGQKVGHAGTLDPLATGVLVVLVGRAVRISEYVMDLPKVYRTTVTLGASTTTYDSEGDVTETSPVQVTEDSVRRGLSRFVGEIQQAPPPYSAAKVEGERAYRLARAGKAVDLAKRSVRVYRAELLRFEPPHLEIEVECGKGTYIRSIAHDLGQVLGCGGHVSQLLRTSVGNIDIESATGVEELRRALADGTWEQLLQPMDVGLMHLPAITIEIEDEKDLRHGQAVVLDEPPRDLAPSDGLIARGYAEDGSLIGIISYDAGVKAWRPRKVLT